MGSDDLIYLTREPINAETPLDRQVGTITPASRHYVRDHFAIPEAPRRLVVDGAVRTELDLALDEIRALPRRSLVVTLECAGNGRAFLDPPVKGEQWGIGAVGTAEWTGTPLRAVLDRAGPLAGAVEVLCVGADAGTPADVGTRIGYERSLSVADALGDRTLLAYEMNGGPIPAEHGAPLRLIVAGWYGMASVKWLARLRVIERPFDGFFQKRRYVVGDRPLQAIAPRAVIASPRDGDTLAAGTFVARGYAWSGRGDLTGVAVSADGGRSWLDAVLGDVASPDAWREWRAEISPARGDIVLIARAMTSDGSAQPLTQVWNALGYENNAVRPVRIKLA